MEMTTIGIIGDRSSGWKKNYYAAVEACGAKTVALISKEDLQRFDELDGIVLPGGADVNPKYYGQENKGSVDIDDELDAFEFALIEKAVSRRLPLFGICRGLQLVNIYFGGTLIQDLENKELHCWEDQKDRSHTVHADRSSFVYGAYHKTDIRVTSAHHQAIDVLGEGLVAVAAAEDNIIEAVQHRTLPIYCVQWHPERMCLAFARPDTEDGLPLFRYFLEMAQGG